MRLQVTMDVTRPSVCNEAPAASTLCTAVIPGSLLKADESKIRLGEVVGAKCYQVSF